MMRIKLAIISLIAVAIYLSVSKGENTTEDSMKECMNDINNSFYDEAKVCFENVISLNSSSPEAWRGLGYAFNGAALCENDIVASQEDYSNAIKCFEKALQLNPNYALAYKDMAGSYFEMGENDDKALELIDKALKIDPNSSDAYNVKGKILKMMRRYDDAIASYHKGEELDPNNEIIRLNREDAENAKKKSL